MLSTICVRSNTICAALIIYGINLDAFELKQRFKWYPELGKLNHEFIKAHMTLKSNNVKRTDFVMSSVRVYGMHSE